MSNVQSYNALIDRFKAFASGHFILKRFSHGQIEVSDLEKFGEYPFMHVVPSNVTYAKGMKTFSFQIVLADLPRDKEDKTEYQREVLSDLQRIAEDLVAEITNHRVLFGDLITVNNVSLEPFLEEFQHTLTGWTISLDLLVPYYWDACSIPAEWNDMFESSTGGTGSILTFIDSITRDENGNVSLVNDEAEPSPNYYYGTNDEGVRGWYLLTDEVGLTCVTLPTCQTIIDIEAAIDLLQQDVIDLNADVALKANTADISAVGFSNDYNDLDNKPTIPAGGLPAGGTTGQILTKVDATDYNATWQENFADWTSVVKHTVKNNGLSGTITKGTAVYVTSSNGTNMLVGRASNTSEATSSKTMGLMQSDITTTGGNQTGFVITEGLLEGLNTAGQTAGDPVWLGVNGALIYGLANKPYAPAHLVFIGIVTKVSAGNGEIFVKVQNGFELKEIHDVDIITTTPINGHLLGFDGTLWVNKTVASWLGYTPVPETRTLTINGTTQDLSANRTFTIATGLTVGTTPITSGTVGRVLFEGTGNVLQESANLFWDNTNNRLGIGTATPASSLQIVGGDITIDNNKSYFAKNAGGSTLSLLKFDTSSNCLIGSNFQGGATNIYATTNILFYSYPSSVLTERMRIVGSTGNVLIGTTTDAGYKLDVNGTARVRGASNLGTTTAFTITNSDSVNVLQVQDNGYIRIGSQATSAFRIYATDASGDSEPSGLHLVLNSRVAAQSQAFNVGMVTINGPAGTATSGTQNVFLINKAFSPTSGTATYAASSIIPTINQTGGANGITRGLYINPTITAAADFRAIETTRGRIVFGNLPTSSAGLPTGAVWNDAGTLKIV